MPYKDKEKQREAWRRHYQKHKKKYSEKNKKTKRIIIEKFKEYKKTLKCSRCEENNPVCLDFHHKNPSEKEYVINRMIRTFGWSRIMKEIKKCEVLCSNCHRKEHFGM